MDDDDDIKTMREHEREARFLDFADMVQIGADAIRENRRLRERLAAAEEDAAKWRDLATEAGNASFGVVTDMVMALCSGALVKGPPEACEAAAKAMDARRAEASQ